MFNFNEEESFWINQPDEFEVTEEKIIINTLPGTDFWQRTYYGFQHDNAHALLIKTREKYFSFTVKCDFQSKNLFDQCGVMIYQDSDNWFKGAIEFHDNNSQWLGSVVTNNGYSDWATTDIGPSVKSMWYRLSRRDSDYCIENSVDGITFHQMRIFHLFKGNDEVNIGVMACSPTNGSFKAEFSHIQITECLWEKHGA